MQESSDTNVSTASSSGSLTPELPPTTEASAVETATGKVAVIGVDTGVQAAIVQEFKKHPVVITENLLRAAHRAIRHIEKVFNQGGNLSDGLDVVLKSTSVSEYKEPIQNVQMLATGFLKEAMIAHEFAHHKDCFHPELHQYVTCRYTTSNELAYLASCASTLIYEDLKSRREPKVDKSKEQIA